MNSKYPMCQEQPAQIDCRKTDCKFNLGGGQCGNISPAIVLNLDMPFYCKSESLELDDEATEILKLRKELSNLKYENQQLKSEKSTLLVQIRILATTIDNKTDKETTNG